MHSNFLPAPERELRVQTEVSCVSVLFVSCVLDRGSYSAWQVGLYDFEGRKETVPCLSALPSPLMWLSCLVWSIGCAGLGSLDPSPEGYHLEKPWTSQFTLGTPGPSIHLGSDPQGLRNPARATLAAEHWWERGPLKTTLLHLHRP